MCFMMLSVNQLYAQSLGSEYKVGLGLRAGETSGITFHINTGNSSKIEIIGGFWSNWSSITGLYEINATAFNTSGLKWFYGGGLHLGSPGGVYFAEGKYYHSREYWATGIDGIVGIEYKIPGIPFAVQANIKPMMEVSRLGSLYTTMDPGLEIIFTF